MGLMCRINGHLWQRGKCKRCGAEHREHEWKPYDRHTYICSVCGDTKLTPHEWKGCMCAVCGETRDEEHVWNILSPCEKICTCCGKHITNHYYEKVEGKCLKRCSRCGCELPIPHSFENGVCSVCGADKNRYYMEQAIAARSQKETWSAAMEITSSECLENVILRCRDYYSKLCCVGYIARLGDDNTLLRIAQNKELDYEIRLKAKNGIGDESLRSGLDIGTDAVYDAMCSMDIKSGM